MTIHQSDTKITCPECREELTLAPFLSSLDTYQCPACSYTLDLSVETMLKAMGETRRSIGMEILADTPGHRCNCGRKLSVDDLFTGCPSGSEDCNDPLHDNPTQCRPCLMDALDNFALSTVKPIDYPGQIAKAIKREQERARVAERAWVETPHGTTINNYALSDYRMHDYAVKLLQDVQEGLI